MKLLERRIKRLEKKLNSKGKDGIAGWALEVADKKKRFDNFYNGNILLLNKVSREQDGENTEDPEPHKLQTEQDVLAFAKELSEKYNSREDYEANKPPMDHKKLEEAIAKIEYRVNKTKSDIGLKKELDKIVRDESA